MAAGPELSAKRVQFLKPEWERSECGKKLVAMCVFEAIQEMSGAGEEIRYV